MKEVRYTTQAKKDLKKYRHDIRKMSNLYEILHLLRSNIPIPQKYRPHMLKGEYQGCMECHIGSDFLLIWIDELGDTIEVVRIGTHSELF